MAAALLFDLDGTLVDTLPDIAAALNATLAEQGADPLAPDKVRALVGHGVRRLVERAVPVAMSGGPNGGLDGAVTAFERHYAANGHAGSQLFPDVAATLTMLRDAGHPMAVCTNKPLAAARGTIAKVGLDGLLTVVGAGDSFPVRKPDPAHIHATLALLGHPPGTPAAMIGDSIVDLEAAHAADLPCVLVRHGYSAVPVDELGAEAVIDGFSELPGVLEGLLA